jgi:hypothetical protein
MSRKMASIQEAAEFPGVAPQTLLYGSRSHKNQKLIDGMKAAVEAAQC